MRASFAALSSLLLSSVSTVAAVGVLRINNWSNDPINFWTGNDANSKVTCAPHAVTVYSFVPNPAGVSLKFTKSGTFQENNIMQFEYTLDSTILWYDLSDINGNPFIDGNVKVSPTGSGANADNCLQVRCPSGATCSGAYNAPGDNLATHACPVATGDMWLDLYEPPTQFSQRSVSFTA